MMAFSLCLAGCSNGDEADEENALKVEIASIEVPQENGYTGNKSNTYVTVTAYIDSTAAGYFNYTAYCFSPDGERCSTANFETDEWGRYKASIKIGNTSSSSKKTYANGQYSLYFNYIPTISSLRTLGSSEKDYSLYLTRGFSEPLEITQFDFDGPTVDTSSIKASYDSSAKTLTITWDDPTDDDFDHVVITTKNVSGYLPSGDEVKKGEKEYTTTKNPTSTRRLYFVDALGNYNYVAYVTISNNEATVKTFN